MNRARFGFGLALVLFVAGAFTLNYSGSDNFGTVISAADLNADSTQWTGWLHMDQSQALRLQVNLTDANSGITMTARCEGSQIAVGNAAAVADDGGYEICGYTYNAGVQTYTCPLTKSLATPGSKLWQWTFEDVDSQWVNCLFTATGAGAADTLTVHAYGVSR